MLPIFSVTVTNVIRFIIDELLPPIIRDNRFFIQPFFYIWFKGNNIKTYMEFKSLAYKMSDCEFSRVYKDLDCLAKNRPTDTNQECIQYALAKMDVSAKTVIDVGCGLGYFVNAIYDTGRYETFGCDVLPESKIKGRYIVGDISKLPFPDKAFDIVTCCHTLEHIRDLASAISELKRICRKQLIVIVPCQRYFYYTLDLHLNFFPISAVLEHTIKMKDYSCKKFGSDWIYIAAMDDHSI